MHVYATTADLQSYTKSDTVPQGAEELLILASDLIERESFLSHYDTDADEMPTDRKIRDAFRNATCAQAAFFVKHGVDPNTGRAVSASVIASKSMGGAALSYAVDKAAMQARATAHETLAPLARVHLRSAGLLDGWVFRL